MSDNSHIPIVTHVNLAKSFRGGECQTLLLIEALKQRKIRQKLIVRANSELYRRATQLKYLEVTAISKPFFMYIARAKGSDLLHAHEAHAAHWCRRVKKFYGIPYIITRRVTHPPKSNRITRSVYNQATCTIALSRAITEVLHSYQPDLPVERIPSMFSPTVQDDERVTELRKKYRGKYVIGHIGALVSHHKGQDYLIEAVRRLVSRYPHMVCIFVGDGKDERKLKQQARSIEQIEFVGFQPRVQDYLSIFDQFAFPSLHEGLGSSIIDAMHFRLPIVASSIEGITDLIQDRVTGLLVPPRSSEELAKAIERIYKSQSLAAQLGQQASLNSSNYSQENIGDRVFSIYQSILTLRY